MSSLLLCPVCARPLWQEQKSYRCQGGHCFDISRYGYVNLLSSGAGTHGDNRLMIAARHAFLEAGFYHPLAAALEELLQTLPLSRQPVLLDVGCGEGYYLSHSAKALSALDPALYAFDISKEALIQAGKRKLSATLFAASAYRVPIASASVDVLTLFFSPYCHEEILRVLKKDGYFLMAIPGEGHLFSLKQALYDTPYKNQVQPFDLDGFSTMSHRHVSGKITLPSQEHIQALFAMTPYYYKTSEKDRQKLLPLKTLTTEIEFELLLYQKH